MYLLDSREVGYNMYVEVAGARRARRSSLAPLAHSSRLKVGLAVEQIK